MLSHAEVWLLVFGIAANLTLYFAIQAFGPLMFTEAFHYSPAEAARMNQYFWLTNLGVLVLTGLVSDRLQVRKPIAIFGGILAALLMAWWIPKFGAEMPRATLTMVASLMGCFLAIAYVPWAAQFSETLEDVSPALQATGWAFFGLVARAWVAISAPLSLYVAVHYGWGRMGEGRARRNDNLHRRDGVLARPRRRRRARPRRPNPRSRYRRLVEAVLFPSPEGRGVRGEVLPYGRIVRVRIPNCVGTISYA